MRRVLSKNFPGVLNEKKKASQNIPGSEDALAAYADVGEVWMGHEAPSTVEPDRHLGASQLGCFLVVCF